MYFLMAGVSPRALHNLVDQEQIALQARTGSEHDVQKPIPRHLHPLASPQIAKASSPTQTAPSARDCVSKHINLGGGTKA